jgi:hypothetical protein
LKHPGDFPVVLSAALPIVLRRSFDDLVWMSHDAEQVMNSVPLRANENRDLSNLAAIIAENEAAIQQGWAELERLAKMLEALNAREPRVIGKQANDSKPVAASPTPGIAAAP